MYANNPQAFMNGFLSGSRNIFLTSSIGIAMYGFSNTFKLDMSVNVVKLISIGIFIFSFLLGLNTLIGYKRYYDILKKDKKNVPEYVDFQIWNNFLYITSIYLIILFLIICLTTLRLYNRIF